jgi:hypothetical protein
VGPSVWPACTTCPAGYSCVSGVSAPAPCGVGYYSAAGAAQCLLCRAGYSCALTTTSSVQMYASPCPAGLYCNNGTSIAPTVELNSCPSGFYCPQAVAAPIACPAGTFNAFTGANQFSNCSVCTVGHWCGAGVSAPSGLCPAGYWCPANTSTSTPTTVCPPATYRSAVGAEVSAACAACPAGYYCPSYGISVPLPCPKGSYCLSGVSVAAACPIGTFSNQTGTVTSVDCTACSPGYYCASVGLTAPTGPCDAGYYCQLGATIAAPINPIQGGVCPAGGFCPMYCIYFVSTQNFSLLFFKFDCISVDRASRRRVRRPSSTISPAPPTRRIVQTVCPVSTALAPTCPHPGSFRASIHC